MWHLFVPLVNQRLFQNIRVAELSAIFSGWNHEPRITKKRAFYLFFVFFIPSVVNLFFGTLDPVGQ